MASHPASLRVAGQLARWPHCESGVSSVKGIITPVSYDHVRKTLNEPVAQS